MPNAALDSKSSQKKAKGAEEYAGFLLCDPQQKRIGRLQKLFVNLSGEPEYIKVRVGFFGFKSILLSVQDITVDERRRTLVLQ